MSGGVGCKALKILLIATIAILTILSVSANTTFFDSQNEFFVMSDVDKIEPVSSGGEGSINLSEKVNETSYDGDLSSRDERKEDMYIDIIIIFIIVILISRLK